MPDDDLLPNAHPLSPANEGVRRIWQPPSVEKIQELLPHYEVIALIGRGGMGAVYKARQKSLRRLVAIKVLPLDAADDELKFAERFKNEAYALARLNHTGIVNVHDAGEADGGLLYFVMEHVEGRDLAQEIAERGRMPQEEVRSIIIQVCEALSYLHGNGIIHRDIKPANIMLTAEGKVKVADFGLAKLDETLVFGRLTRTGTSMGTAEFMAPESRKPGGVVDHRADLFSLGVMLYQMLTGELPHGMFKLPSQRLPEIDERFDDIICKALEPKPEDRYQNAAEMQNDLAAVCASRTRTAAAPIKKKAAHAWWWAAGISAVLVIAGLILMSAKPRSPAQAGTIDLLALVDVKRDAIAGEWSREGDDLIVQAGSVVSTGKGQPRLQLPYEPSGEYDFEIEFTPGPGSNVYQVLSAEGRQFAWVMDSGNTGVKRAGFETIAGTFIRDRWEGAVTRPKVLTTGQRHRSRVEVRKNGLRGFLDDELLVTWGKGPDSFQSLGAEPPLTLRDTHHLGLAAQDRALRIHRIMVREISGARSAP